MEGGDIDVEGWDEILCRKGKISYGNDLLSGCTLPTTSVIDGDIIRALGWLQMPTIEFMCGDLVWRDIGSKLGILECRQDVIVEHRHWSAFKREPDATTMKVNSAKQMQRDNIAYRDWAHNHMAHDIIKIQEALCVKSV